MKGIIMEINKNKMVVMDEDGTFVESKLISNSKIGQEVNITLRSKIYTRAYKYSFIAAAFLLFVLGGFQVKSYYTPYGYVNIDINPSIEVGYNKFERVISVKGLNDDGQKVIADTEKVNHGKLEEVVESLVETAGRDNYLKENEENQILLSTYSPDTQKSSNVKAKVNNSVLLYLNKQTKKAEIINEIVSKEDRDKAEVQKISVGKLKLYEKAKKVDSNITLEDVVSKPVRETVKAIKEKEKEQKAQSNANKQETINNSENKKTVTPDNSKESKQEKKTVKDVINQDIKPNIQNSNNNQNGVKRGTNPKDNNKPTKVIQMPKIESEQNAKDRVDKIRERMKEIYKKNKNIEN